MGNSCGCAHCDCDGDKDEKSPEEKVEELKKDIASLGYLVEDTPDGEIKIIEK
jgi:hypothetical protein